MPHVNLYKNHILYIYIYITKSTNKYSKYIIKYIYNMFSQQIVYKFFYFVNNILLYSYIYAIFIYIYMYIYISIYLLGILYVKVYPCIPVRSVCPIFLSFNVFFFFFAILPSHYLSPTFSLEGNVLFYYSHAGFSLCMWSYNLTAKTK